MRSDSLDSLPFSRNTALFILLALALLIFVGNSGWPALEDDVDAGHAEVSQEMLQTGDWAVLHMNGVRWLEKAPFHYWAVAVTYMVLGVSAFATRLPVALGVAGLTVMVYIFGRRFFGDRGGFYSGLVMATSMGTYIYTRVMIPEAIYALEFTAAFYLFLCAWLRLIPLRAGFWGAAALCGLAVLTRAMIGIFFPVAILSIFVMLTGRRYSWREMPVVSSLLIFLAIAAPWHLIAGLRTPGFFWYYFMNEQVLRAFGLRYPHDYSTVPLLLWWAEHLVWLFPWSVFLPLAFRRLPKPQEWRNLDESRMPLLFVCVWAGFVFLFFSFTGSRLEYYTFSAWPAAALLIGRGIALAERESSPWLRRLQAGVAVIGAMAACTLGWLLWVSRDVVVRGDITTLLNVKQLDAYILAMDNFTDLTTRAFAALRTPSVLAALLFLFGLSGVYWLRRRGDHLPANLATAAVMAVFFFAANLAFQTLEPHISSKPLADILAPQLKQDDAVVIYGEYYGGSTLGFYLHRRVFLFNGREQGLEYGSYYPDAPKLFLDDHDFPALWRSSQRVFLFAPKGLTQEVLVRLPRDSSYLMAQSGGKFLFVNQPLKVDQPSLSQLQQQGYLPAALRR